MKYNIIHKKETTSTFNDIKDLMRRGNPREYTTVYADYQSEGRGQRGNKWNSNIGKNLLFSTLLKPLFLKANKQFLITQAVALGVHDVLSNYTDNISIKWPNDIYWNEKKICGILIETDLIEDYVASSILGIGINLNQTDMTGAGTNPVSLYEIIHREVNIEEVLKGFLRRLYYYYEQLKSGDEIKIQTVYASVLFRKEGYYNFADANGTFEACIKHVSPNGILHLGLKNGEERSYAFKEVQYIINDNKL